MSTCFGVNVHIFMLVCTRRRFTGFYGVRWTLYRVRGWKGWKHALRAFYGVFVWGVGTSRTRRDIFTAGLNFTLCGVVLMGGVDIHITYPGFSYPILWYGVACGVVYGVT